MYEDLDRPPLRTAALQRALAGVGWRLEVLARVASTNAEVARRAGAGEPAGLVVVAEEQTSGRGRLDRVWTSPPRAGLTFSVLLRPAGPPAQWAWSSLHAGVAVARSLQELAGLDAVLKWPNDVLVGGRKICGVLAEAVPPDAVVVGVGVNVTTRPAELPATGTATSLLLEGAVMTDREPLLRAILRALPAVLAAADRDAYRGLCSTLGQRVRIELPAGSVEGWAERVDDDGRLVVDGTGYGAGDVVHLRPVTRADEPAPGQG